MPRRPSARQLAPLGIRGFRLLFLSTLGSSLGTLLAAIALAIDVKDRTDSGIWVGAVLVVEFLPPVFVGLTLGPLLDRLQRRRLMVGADLVRAAVFCALPFASSAGEIVALAAVAGLATGFFRPAVYAGVPNLVPEELLPEANAVLQTIENVSWAAGPVLGGLLTAAAGPHAAYWINAVSFLVSAALVVRIPARQLQSATALSRGHWTDLKDGFTAVLRSRPLLAVLLGWGIASLGAGGVSVSEVFMAKDTLGRRRLRLRTDLRRHRHRARARELVEQLDRETARNRADLRPGARGDGARVRRRSSERRHLDGCGVLRRRRHRERHGGRVQRVARPAQLDATSCAGARSRS